MSSSTDFENKAKELKEKIYNKYSKNLDSVKETLIPALISIYGEKYSDLITQKMNQIQLINFFTRLDLHSYFLSEHKFIPRVLNQNESEDNIDSSDELFENLEELEELLSTFYDDDIFPEESEKIFDKDVFEYLQICSEYDLPLTPIYYDEINNKIIEDKSTHEYNIHTSMHSCVKKEISKLDLLLDRFFLYDNLYDSLNLNNVSIIHNVNKNFEKVDILMINPFKLNTKNICSLIYFIIQSIHTDLISNQDNRFLFDSGLLDTFEKHNFSNKEDLFSIYYNFTAYICKRITLEVINYLQNHNLSIWNISPIPSFTLFSDDTLLSELFYHYKRLFLDAIITKNNTTIFNTIGKENYKKYFESYFELNKLYESHEYDSTKSSELYNLIKSIFKDMKKYKNLN